MKYVAETGLSTRSSREGGRGPRCRCVVQTGVTWHQAWPGSLPINGVITLYTTQVLYCWHLNMGSTCEEICQYVSSRLGIGSGPYWLSRSICHIYNSTGIVKTANYVYINNKTKFLTIWIKVRSECIDWETCIYSVLIYPNLPKDVRKNVYSSGKITWRWSAKRWPVQFECFFFTQGELRVRNVRNTVNFIPSENWGQGTVLYPGRTEGEEQFYTQGELRVMNIVRVVWERTEADFTCILTRIHRSVRTRTVTEQGYWNSVELRSTPSSLIPLMPLSSECFLLPEPGHRLGSSGACLIN